MLKGEIFITKIDQAKILNILSRAGSLQHEDRMLLKKLEDELAKGLWFRMAAREADVFGADPHGLWRRLLRRRGGHVGLLSTWADDPGLN